MNVDEAIKMFEEEDFEDYEKMMEEWYRQFVVDKRSYLIKLALENVDMTLFTDKQRDICIKFIELFVKNNDPADIINRVKEFRQSMRDVPLEVALLVIATVHAEVAMLVKGTMTIIEGQVISRMKKMGNETIDNPEEIKEKIKELMKGMDISG